MDAEKIRNLTDEELRHQEREMSDELFKLRFSPKWARPKTRRNCAACARTSRALRPSPASARRQGRRSNGGNTNCRTPERADRPCSFKPYEQDDRRPGGSPQVAPAVHEGDFEGEKILCPRREERGSHRRCGEARGDAAAFEAKAVEAERDSAQDGAGARGRNG